MKLPCMCEVVLFHCLTGEDNLFSVLLTWKLQSNTDGTTLCLHWLMRFDAKGTSQQANGITPKSKSLLSHAADFFALADTFGLFQMRVIKVCTS